MTLLLLLAGVGDGSDPPTDGLSGGFARLGLQVFEDATEAVMIADWTSRAENITVETGPHGHATLSATIPITTEEAFRFYDSTTAAHVVLGDGSFRAFEGRIEDRPLSPDSFGFTGFGYFRSMFDVVYKSLWSTKIFRSWRVMNQRLRTNRTPEKYHMDQDGHLYITLRKNEAYGDTIDGAAYYYEISQSSDRELATLSFDYDLTLPTNWLLRINSYAADMTGAVVEATVATGDTTNQSSSHSETITASKWIVEVLVINNTGGTYTNSSNETDDWYCELTNVRVKTTASATVEANEIVDDLISYTNGVNDTQISSSTALVDSPNIDLDEAEYMDRYPGDILNELAEIGNDSDPVERYEWGVWEGQQLHFRKRASQAQEWYIDLGDFHIDGTLDTVLNSFYAVYTNDYNKTRRTALSDDSGSQSKYGVIRRGYVRASQAVDSPEAQTYRDAQLEDSKDITPRAQIVTDKIYTASGALAPIYLPRAGDNCTIRNLSPTGSSLVDKIRSFRIHRTSLDCDTGVLTITPEMEMPSLVDLVAANTKARGD